MEFHISTYTGKYINKTANHLYIAPIKGLEKVVAHYTITFQNQAHDIPKNSVLHLIPDVSGCFVFHFFDDLSITVWGATTKIVIVDNDLNTAKCRFFVEFLPGGLYQVLGLSMRDLLDKKIELEDLCHDLYQEIHQNLLQMTTFDEIVNLMNHILLREVKKHQMNQTIQSCLEYLQSHHEKINIQDLSQKCHLSERQLNRYFHQYIGMSIKKFMKIINMNYLIQELQNKNLLDLTYDYEYFDQAHFNHVFKEVCETTPTHYLENLSDFYNELYKFSLK